MDLSDWLEAANVILVEVQGTVRVLEHSVEGTEFSEDESKVLRARSGSGSVIDAY